MIDEFVVVFRPIGPKEYEELRNLKFKKWPPRPPDQPLFYFVTDEMHAKKLTQWNVKQFGIGFVTKFKLQKKYFDNFEKLTIGATFQAERYIQAQNLDELNRNIINEIAIIEEIQKEN